MSGFVVKEGPRKTLAGPMGIDPVEGGRRRSSQDGAKRESLGLLFPVECGVVTGYMWKRETDGPRRGVQ